MTAEHDESQVAELGGVPLSRLRDLLDAAYRKRAVVNAAVVSVEAEVGVYEALLAEARTRESEALAMFMAGAAAPTVEG